MGSNSFVVEVGMADSTVPAHKASSVGKEEHASLVPECQKAECPSAAADRRIVVAAKSRAGAMAAAHACAQAVDWQKAAAPMGH